MNTRAVQDLSELIRLQTKQFLKYGAVFISQSNLYLESQILQIILQMKLRQKKDNPDIIQQSLATMIMQKFDRSYYTDC